MVDDETWNKTERHLASSIKAASPDSLKRFSSHFRKDWTGKPGNLIYHDNLKMDAWQCAKSSAWWHATNTWASSGTKTKWGDAWLQKRQEQIRFLSR